LRGGESTTTPRSSGTLAFSDEFEFTGSPRENGWREDTSNRLGGCPRAVGDGDVLTVDAGQYNNCGLFRTVDFGRRAIPRAEMRARSLESNLPDRHVVALRLSAVKSDGPTGDSATLVFRRNPGRASNKLLVQAAGQRTQYTTDRAESTDWHTMALGYDGERTYAGTASERFLVADRSPPLTRAVRVEFRNGNSINEYDYVRLWRVR
jgi:hypothetical protein